MTTLMPAALDTFVNPAAADLLSSATVPHAAQHDTLNDAMAAVEKITVGPAVYNVKGYGALGDGLQVSDGALTTGTTALTSATGLFTAAHVGKQITVRGAGAAGVNLSTTIAAYTSPTAVTLSAAASTTVSAATVTWGTDDSAALQAAVTAANAAGGGIVWLPAGRYLVASNITYKSNVTLWGHGRGVTTLCAVGACTCVLFASATLANAALGTLTVDGNFQASCALFVGQANDTITADSCRFTGAVQNSTLGGVSSNLGWAAAFGTTTNATPNGGTAAASKNITFTRNIVGPNQPFYEACILVYCVDSVIEGNTFRDNTTTALATGLAIYAYCSNIAINGNVFSNNDSFDCYLQQSDTVTMATNVFSRVHAGTSLGIFSCRNVLFGHATGVATVTGCLGVQVFDQYDYGLTAFNTNVSLYPYSKDLSIGPATFSGYYEPVKLYAPAMTTTQVGVNLVQDVDIHDLEISNPQAYACIYGVQVGGANIQSMQRIRVRNIHHSGGNYSGGAGVIVQGNPGITATTTTQAITASAAKQTVTVASTTGISAGMWLHVDDGSHGTAEEIYVYSVPVSGQIQSIFRQTHTSGAALANSTTLVNSGLTDVTIKGAKVQPSTSGNSSGITLFNVPQSCNVDLFDNDLSNAGSGTLGKVALFGTGAYRTARGNLGFNPVIAPTAPIASPVTATWYQNTTGVDCYVQVKQTTVTGTHLYVNNSASTTGALDYGAATAWPGVVFVPAGAYVQFVFSAGTVALVWQGN